MAGLFRRLFGGRPAQKDADAKSRAKAKARFASKAEVHFDPKAGSHLVPPGAGAARAEDINTLIRDWQVAWHDLFDADQSLIAAGEFERPDPIPDRHDCDFRLIFGLSRAEKATRDACFALMPNGADMATRLDAYLAADPAPLSEAQAREVLADLTQRLLRLDPCQGIDFDRIRVIDRDTADGLEALRRTDDILHILSRSPAHPRQSDDLRARATLTFLSEPLYATCGNYYHLRDWVTGVLFDPQWDEVQGILYRMWDGGWQVRIDEDAVVLAKRRIGPKAT